MLRIALCDNDKGALPVVSGAAQAAFQSQKIETKIDCFSSGKDLINALRENRYHIFLLDIDMPDMDGIELGKKLRSAGSGAEIVYVSECEDRVFEAFSVFPLGFVRKSNFLNDIADVVTLYMRKHTKSSKTEVLTFTTRTAVQSVPRRKIKYIEGSGNYQMVYIADQAAPLEIKMTMDRLEEVTEPLGFIRIHKGYLVNYLYIQGIQSNQVILKGDIELPIGRSKVKEVKSKYLSLLGN